MKKFILFILFTVSIYSQDYILLMDSSPYYSYVAANVGATVSEDQIIFSGASTRTKTTKALGTNRAVTRYMRWWIDSTDVIANGTFDSDNYGWHGYINSGWGLQVPSGFLDSTYWVASGGGLTGALRVVGGTSNALIIQNQAKFMADTTQFNYLSLGTYRFQCDIVVDSLKTGYSLTLGSRRTTSIPPGVVSFLPTFYRITQRGTYAVDTVITIASSGYFQLTIQEAFASFPAGEGTRTRFYLDNVSLISVVDSVLGYTKNLSTVAEDIPYYYSQTVSYTTKTGTPVWDADDVDTCYSLPNAVNFVSVTPLEDQFSAIWTDASDSELGYLVRYTSEMSEGFIYADTTAADVTNLIVDGLANDTFYVQIQTIGHNANSTWSAAWEVIVAGIVDSSDTTAPAAPTNLDALNLDVVVTAPADTIPIFTPTSFTNKTSIGLDSLCISNAMALSGFDSCYAYAAGDSFRVGVYGDTVTAYTRVHLNDTLYLIKSSSGSYSTTVTCSLTVGGVLKTWAITTLVEPGSYNVWYVDVNSPTAGDETASNGKSWATAWTNLDSLGHYAVYKDGVNWEVISAGDTIYVKTGTYYNQQIDRLLGTHRRDFTSPVYVRPYGGTVTFKSDTIQRGSGFATGTAINCLLDTVENLQRFTIKMLAHNLTPGKTHLYAKVIDAVTPDSMTLESDIFVDGDEYEVLAGAGVFTISGVSNVNFKGFNFNYDLDLKTLGSVLRYADSLIVMDSIDVLNNSRGGAIVIQEAKNQLLNSNIYIYDAYNDMFPQETDFMSMTGGKGGHIVDGNVLTRWRPDTVDIGHWDFVQISDIGLGEENYETRISNNIFLDLADTMTHQNGMIYQDGLMGHQRFLIYNNIFAARNSQFSHTFDPFRMGDHPFDGDTTGRGGQGWSNSIRIFNNTILLRGLGIFFNLDWADTLVVKNNVFVADTIMPDTRVSFGVNIGESMNVDSLIECNYNYYATRSEMEDLFGHFFTAPPTFSETVSFTRWRSEGGYDLNSDTTNSANVTFVNKYGNTPADWYTTFGRDGGTDLSAYFTTDLAGETRSGTWDAGALEYVGALQPEIWRKLRPIMQDNWEADFWKGDKR